MNPKAPLSRRQTLELSVATCAAAASAAFSAACAKKEEKSATLTCTDTSALSPTDVEMRTSLRYVDRSVDAAKNCANCIQYVPSAAPNSCGGCKILKGPIHPAAYCLSWSAKTT